MSTLLRGTVTRVEGNHLHLSVPAWGGAEYGPCESVMGLVFTPGDRVVFTNIGDIPSDIVVLGIIA